ncbi:MAG TPA: glycosyltransferase, partial [Candidatus Angelobacter sp.]|nr:glycosyltransferase [Candidatus Angelobacter sp.]
AMSRAALNAIGGLKPLVDYLADDFELGFRISNVGYEVVLANVVVETHLPAYSLRGFFQHQMRWSRSMRDSRRAGYIGLLFTFGLPWAIFSVLLAPLSWWSWAALAAAAFLRTVLAIKVGIGIVQDRTLWRGLWLLPLRDLVAFWFWIASFASNNVYWRGEIFLLKNGQLRRNK